MNPHRVLVLTDNGDATAMQLPCLRQFDNKYWITFKARSEIGKQAHTAINFDLIIIEAHDGTMQDVLEICRCLRFDTTAPILVVSPLADETYALAAHKAGADDYIVGPISPALWHAKLRAWLRWTVPGFQTVFAPGQEMPTVV